MNKLVFIFLLVFGCSPKSDNEQKAEDTDNPTELEVKEADKFLLDKINQKIDSAILFYEIAIKAANEGKSENEIKGKYEDKVIGLNQEISHLVDSVTSIYIKQNRSQQEYDLFMKKIELQDIQERHEKLIELGVFFDLKKNRN